MTSPGSEAVRGDEGGEAGLQALLALPTGAKSRPQHFVQEGAKCISRPDYTPGPANRTKREGEDETTEPRKQQKTGEHDGSIGQPPEVKMTGQEEDTKGKGKEDTKKDMEEAGNPYVYIYSERGEDEDEETEKIELLLLASEQQARLEAMWAALVDMYQMIRPLMMGIKEETKLLSSFIIDSEKKSPEDLKKLKKELLSHLKQSKRIVKEITASTLAVYVQLNRVVTNDEQKVTLKETVDSQADLTSGDAPLPDTISIRKTADVTDERNTIQTVID